MDILGRRERGIPTSLIIAKVELKFASLREMFAVVFLPDVFPPSSHLRRSFAWNSRNIVDGSPSTDLLLSYLVGCVYLRP